MPRFYKVDSNDFQAWLSQPIWAGCERIPRRSALPVFAEGITNFMKNMGYKMDSRWNQDNGLNLARWIYRIQVQEELRMDIGGEVYVPEIIHRNTVEDFDHFHHIVSCDAVRDFMRQWNKLEDTSCDTKAGERIWNELQDFLYVFVELESSKQGKVIARFWEDANSDSDSDTNERKRDTYLRDANKGYHG
jgi:hypothetical protein